MAFDRTQIHGFIWSTPYRKMATSVLATITLLAGTITAVNSAWPVIEPGFPAHRYYVRSVVNLKDIKIAQAEKILRDLQIEQAEGKRDAADFELNRLQLELTKSHTDEEKLKIQADIIKAQNTKANLVDQISTLKKIRESQ